MKIALKALICYSPGPHRWAYLLLAFGWSAVCWKKVMLYPWEISWFGVAYFTEWMVVVILLLLHVIYPTLLGWGLIFLLSLGWVSYGTYLFLSDLFYYNIGFETLEGPYLKFLSILVLDTLCFLFFYVFRPGIKLLNR